MALTYSTLGEVDPPASKYGESGQPTDIKCRVVDITVSASDYVGSNGGITPAASAFGMNTIVFAHATVRGSTGALDTTLWSLWDATNKGLRFLEINTASATTINTMSEITSADFSDGDIVRVTAFGV